MTSSDKSTTKFVRDNLFKIPAGAGEKPRLIGSKCAKCGEAVFPRMPFCPNCCSRHVDEILIGPFGKLYSFTIIYQECPGGYRGPVPYGVAKVEMSEGLYVTGYSTENNPEKYKPGMQMELIIDTLFRTDDTDIIGFKFKPA